jgi:PTH2 family peptidyl-tRNA hydrolase
MSEIKQVIVYRRDLKMRKGKIAAQVAHASLKVFFDRCQDAVGWVHRFPEPDTGSERRPEDASIYHSRLLVIPCDEPMWTWSNGAFAKIVLSVETEEDLLKVQELALAAGLPCALITDAGRTEFHGVPTNTTVAIGPAPAEEIDKITGPSGLVATKLA